MKLKSVRSKKTATKTKTSINRKASTSKAKPKVFQAKKLSEKYFILALCLLLLAVATIHYYLRNTSPKTPEILVQAPNLPNGCQYFSNLATDSRNVDISGDKVVWEDSRLNKLHDIYAQKWTASTPKALTNWSGDQLYPRISGSKIIFYSGGNIYQTTFSGSTPTVFTKPSAEAKFELGGSWVVWSATDGDIYARKTGSSNAVRVSTSPYADSFPVVDGNLVIWQQGSQGGLPTLMGYHLVTKQRFTIAQTNINNWPAVSGNDTTGYLIVWSSAADQYTPNVIKAGMFYPNNPTNFVIKEITPQAPQHQLMPAVSGNLIVWAGHSEVAVGAALKSYRYPNGPIKTVVEGNGTKGFENPKVSGNYVVWSENDISAPYYHDVAGCDVTVRGL